MPVNTRQQDMIANLFTGACLQKKVCPVKDILAVYGDKWSLYTILLLGQHGRARFSELRTGITGISQRMLTVTLRSLEEDGIASRTLYPEIPPRVEYSLTPLGESLLQQILKLANWADANKEEILKARRRYGRNLK